MPAEKYHREYLETQLKPELKEQLRADGKDPTHLPSYEYLNAHGFDTRGLNTALQRHFDSDITIHEFLRNRGFGDGYEGHWPCTHQETINQLNGFRESRKRRHRDAESTLKTIDAALRKVLQTAQQLHQTDNLLFFARYGTESERFEMNEQVEDILDTFITDLSDEAEANYRRYFKEFYRYAEIHVPIDYNPVAKIEFLYRTDGEPNKDPMPLADEQLSALWQILKQLPETKSHHPAVESLLDRYGTGIWQVYMMALLVIGVGVGPRAMGFVRMHCFEDWNLGNDPYIEFPVRKNKPGEVPILTRADFLGAFRDFMAQTHPDWNGKPFPNESNTSGSRSCGTLNNWLEALCKAANVRLEDGSYPTLQNLRQTWHTKYKRVLRTHDVHIEIIADDAGTENDQYSDARYVPDAEERKTIRDFATEDFNQIFSLNQLPPIMRDVVDETEYIAEQSSLREF